MQIPGSHPGLQSQILIPRPMGGAPTAVPVTCHQTESGLWYCQAPVRALAKPRVRRNARHPPEVAQSPAGCRGSGGCGISPVGHGRHNIGSQKAEPALISPKKVSGPNLSDLETMWKKAVWPAEFENGLLPQARHLNIHISFFSGVRSNVKPGQPLGDLWGVEAQV